MGQVTSMLILLYAIAWLIFTPPLTPGNTYGPATGLQARS